MLFFNVDNGYLEGIVRGYKMGLLHKNQYADLTQCASMDDLRLQLSATDYSAVLQNEGGGSINGNILGAKCTQHLVGQFNYLRANSVEPLSRFLDFITYGFSSGD